MTAGSHSHSLEVPVKKRQALRQRQTTQMFLVMVIFYRVLTLLMALYPA
ncbi:hypothetical protein [Escherichia coli]